MANHRIVIYPDLPRMATIHAKLNNHPCSQPAHLVWPPLASPLRISGLQPHWLAFNSSKHYTFPDLRVLALFPLPSLYNTLLPLPTYLFLLDSYLSFSLTSNYHLLRDVSSSLPDKSDIPFVKLSYLYFFHSNYNKCGFTYIHSPHD